MVQRTIMQVMSSCCGAAATNAAMFVMTCRKMSGALPPGIMFSTYTGRSSPNSYAPTLFASITPSVKIARTSRSLGSTYIPGQQTLTLIIALHRSNGNAAKLRHKRRVQTCSTRKYGAEAHMKKWIVTSLLACSLFSIGASPEARRDIRHDRGDGRGLRRDHYDLRSDRRNLWRNAR